MTRPTSQSDASRGGSPEFPPTRWSLVGQAGDQQTRVAAEALETLCRAYWYPLYAFLRRSGYSPPDAQDWVQSFFEYLLENRIVGKARQEKGRFRSFLLATLKHFISSEQRRLDAQKRIERIPVGAAQGLQRFRRDARLLRPGLPDQAPARRWKFRGTSA